MDGVQRFESDFLAAWPTTRLHKAYVLLRLWDSYDDRNHYSKNLPPSRGEFAAGRHHLNIHLSYIYKKYSFPPLHTKFGFMKNSFKAMDQHGVFQYLLEKFGIKKSEVKIKAGVFVRPEIRNQMKSENFGQHLNSLELHTWYHSNRWYTIVLEAKK